MGWYSRNAAVVACGEKKHFESEDQLFGEYENVKFRISDVVTKKTVRRDDKRKVEEIFSGQVLCLFGFDDLKVSKGAYTDFWKRISVKFYWMEGRISDPDRKWGISEAVSDICRWWT